MKPVVIRRKFRSIQRRFREARLFAKGLKSTKHPILVQIIPTRRCNLSCAYCNEYDDFSKPVPTTEMLHRIDLLAKMGTTAITISGGEPLLHPELEEIVKQIRNYDMLAGVISNCYLLTRERIRKLNRAGLDSLQISIDNVMSDEVSKKSLRVLDQKLLWLSDEAEFDVIINSVVGSAIRNPEDALIIAKRAMELGFTTTVGIIHDGSGQLKPLDERRRRVYEEYLKLVQKPFNNFAQYNQFQRNMIQGFPNDWRCRSGSRYLYVCEDGLVHYCSQQRGYPAIPLEKYTQEDRDREYHTVKPCAPYCTISCVHRVATVDHFREKPLEMLSDIFPPKQNGSGSGMPIPVRLLTWMFLPKPGSNRSFLQKTALRLLKV